MILVGTFDGPFAAGPAGHVGLVALDVAALQVGDAHNLAMVLGQETVEQPHVAADAAHQEQRVHGDEQCGKQPADSAGQLPADCECRQDAQATDDHRDEEQAEDRELIGQREVADHDRVPTDSRWPGAESVG